MARCRCAIGGRSDRRYFVQFQNTNNYRVEFRYQTVGTGGESFSSNNILEASATTIEVRLEGVHCGSGGSQDVFISTTLTSIIPSNERDPIVSTNGINERTFTMFPRNAWSNFLNINSNLGCAARSERLLNGVGIIYQYKFTNSSSSKIYIKYSVSTQSCTGTTPPYYEITLSPNSTSPPLFIESICNFSQSQATVTFNQIIIL